MPIKKGEKVHPGNRKSGCRESDYQEIKFPVAGRRYSIFKEQVMVACYWLKAKPRPGEHGHGSPRVARQTFWPCHPTPE